MTEESEQPTDPRRYSESAQILLNAADDSSAISRRHWLRGAVLATLAGVAWRQGWIAPALAASRPEAAFAARTATDASAAIAEGAAIVETDAITIEAPELAEDGAVVPVTISATLDGTSAFAIIGEKNPAPLVAVYEMGPGLEQRISTRVRLAESSHIVVLARARDGLYAARRYVKVTKGGCD